MFPLKSLALIAITTLALTACGGDKGATDANADGVKARQDLMQDWRGANDIMKGMMEKPDTFDAASFKEQAEFIKNSNADMWGHFADANAKGESQDAVWSDATGFAAAKDKFSVAVINLAEAANNAKVAGDVEQAFGAVAESCGSCHKAYKKS